MANIVIFGTGYSADVARVYLQRYSNHQIVGFTVDRQYATTQRFHDLPVVAWDSLEGVFPPDQVELLGPISYSRMNQFRRERYREGKARNYRFASFIHPQSNVETEEIGAHCFIQSIVWANGSRFCIRHLLPRLGGVRCEPGRSDTYWGR